MQQPTDSEALYWTYWTYDGREKVTVTRHRFTDQSPWLVAVRRHSPCAVRFNTFSEAIDYAFGENDE